MNFQRKLQGDLKDNQDDIDKYVVCLLETPDPFSDVTWKKYVDFPSPLRNREISNNKCFSLCPPSKQN